VLCIREHTPSPYPSIVFTFGLAVESIKEFTGASLMGTFLNNHDGKKMDEVHPLYNICDGCISCVINEKMKVHVHELRASMNENLMMMDEFHLFG
jgi:hypothetical protein